MPDLRHMSPADAIRWAKDVSGLTAEEIAERSGLSPHLIRRYMDKSGNYLPGLDKIPMLCKALGNTLILEWIRVQAKGDNPNIQPAKDRAEVLTAALRASACLCEVHRLLAETARSGITMTDARVLRSGLRDLMAESERMYVMLDKQAGEEGRLRALLSLRTARRWLKAKIERLKNARLVR